MAGSRLVVIKLGGSLLTLPDWPSRLLGLLASHPGIRPLVIAGGGQIVDEIRGWDHLFLLGEDASHELAMEALRVTALLAARLIPAAELVDSQPAAEQCWSRGKMPVLRGMEQDSQGLPRCWDVTSDSLAAEVARNWHADELWLLKSVDAQPGMTCREASLQGLLDAHFRESERFEFQVKWCNLRAERPGLVSLQTSGPPPS